MTTLAFHPCLIWFTGLSGAGKTTTANALAEALKQRGLPHYLLDGDKLRQGLCRDLGFSEADRFENIRRIGETAKLMLDAGLIVISATISPYRQMRDQLRRECAAGQFIEVFVDAPLALCEARDPKGLYKRARAGKLANFTGVDAEYQAPLAPELHLNSAQKSTTQLVVELMGYLQHQGLISEL